MSASLQNKRNFGIVRRMMDFFRKVKIVRRLKRLTIKADRSNAEDETGVPFAIPRGTFLGAIAENDWWGLPFKWWGKQWEKDRIAKDRSLLRNLAEEDPPKVKLETKQERDDEAVKRMRIATDRTYAVIQNPIWRDNNITVRLLGKGYTYPNPTEVFERFLREFVGVSGILLMMIGAIWASPYLVALREIIFKWVGLD